jgi:hypothetical protein
MFSFSLLNEYVKSRYNTPRNRRKGLDLCCTCAGLVV